MAKAKKSPAKKSSKGKGKGVMSALRKKAAKSKKFSASQLKKSYDKGLAAYLSSGSRKGMTAHQWAHARVNSANPSKSWAVVKKAKGKNK